MGTTVKEYRKKPVKVRAVQWDGSVESATYIIDWALENGGTIRYHSPVIEDGEYKYVSKLAIDTLDSTAYAFAGDWVICGTINEFYPCNQEVFEQSYEERVYYNKSLFDPNQKQA